MRIYMPNKNIYINDRLRTIKILTVPWHDIKLAQKKGAKHEKIDTIIFCKDVTMFILRDYCDNRHDNIPNTVISCVFF
jgi:hypothetical protein